MRRSRGILLFLTVVAYLLPLAALGYVWLLVFGALDNVDESASVLFAQSLWLLGGLWGASALAVLTLMVVYLRHVFRNATLDANWKAVWTLGIVFVQLPVMVVYWIFHMRAPHD